MAMLTIGLKVGVTDNINNNSNARISIDHHDMLFSGIIGGEI